MPTTSLTTAEAAVQITRGGYSWAGAQAVNTPAEVTFGFRDTSLRPDFAQSTDSQKASFELALALYSDVANIKFTAVNAAGTTDNATMLFSNYIGPGDGQAAFAHMPAGPDTSANSEDGDVWINLGYESAVSQPLGSYDFKTILHELGHAIGLDHPGNYNGDVNGTLTYQANAGYIEDSRQYSVMSYFEAYETGAFHYSSVAGGVQYASTLLLHDIAAVQRIYGANMTTRAGDTVYGFNSTAGIDSYDFTKNQGPVIAIWDAGGAHDVLDASGYAFNQVIDLHAGAFSDIGGMRKNVAIADGTTIEDAIGGSLDDTITGNAAANILSGNGGWDTISGQDGNDTINGNDGNDSLIGGAGNDTMCGGAGDDTMTGGDGADAYYVDAIGDRVIETNAVLATGGDDIVLSILTYTLTANVERLSLSGTGVINGTGNTLANAITGNGTGNVLSGLAGNDTLSGLAGNDTLNGGAGADHMYGGDGSDTYYIDAALDAVVETNAVLSVGGNDLVISTVTHTLGVNVERLTLSGALAINGTGNVLANTIVGNAAANSLSGLAGNDSLNGAGGNDTLTGGVGNDYFVFNALLNATTNVDRIADFNAVADTIRIENAIFTKIAGLGALTAAQFWMGTAAHDANDRIVYNKTTGALYYDSNGNAAGGSVQFAVLTTHPVITNADFFII
jgi:serralysin